MKFRLIMGLCSLAMAAAIMPARAAEGESGKSETREAARKLAAEYRQAMVTIRIVTAMGGTSGQELKSESSGTVVNPDGLTLVSLNAIDPATMIRNMIGGSGMEGMMGQFDSRVKDIKIVLEDRTEVPATVVLRDPDLNMAFLRPLEKPAQPMKAIDLSKGADAELLDSVIILSRLGSVADREIQVQTDQITAIMKRPRKFYVPGGTTSFGSPAFLEDGELLGIVLMRMSGGGMEGLMSGLFSLSPSNMGLLPVVLPAADVAEVASQAPMEGEKLDEAPAAEETAPAEGSSDDGSDMGDKAPADKDMPDSE